MKCRASSFDHSLFCVFVYNFRFILPPKLSLLLNCSFFTRRFSLSIHFCTGHWPTTGNRILAYELFFLSLKQRFSFICLLNVHFIGHLFTKSSAFYENCTEMLICIICRKKECIVFAVKLMAKTSYFILIAKKSSESID